LSNKGLRKLKAASALVAALILLSMFFALATSQVAAATTPELDIIVEEGNITDYIWSSDGTMVAYVVCPEGQGWGDLWIAEWNGKEITSKQVISQEAEYNGLEDWQGDWILFRIRREDIQPTVYYGRNELWKIRADGNDLTQITFTYTNGIKYTENGAYIHRGSAGYGKFIIGTDLVYFSAHNGNGWYRPFVCNDDGTDGWYCVSASNHPYSFTTGISPTGNKLVWGDASYWDESTRALMTCNPDGSGRVQIGSFIYRTSPLVLADGNTVVYNFIRTRYIGEPPLAGNIYAMDIDGSNPRTVIDDEYYNTWASYNPVDAQALLMTSDRNPDGNKHIFKINLDGTGIEQMTSGPYNDGGASYSVNAHELLYMRTPIDEGPSQLVIRRIVQAVEIDIKPGGTPNSINLKSKGKIPVAILTTDDFDASAVNPVTVEFAGASPLKWHLEDVDFDCDFDLVMHFATQELMLTHDSTQATLTGETWDYLLILGIGSVRIVPP
jgi:Tol biopolymer transport system component